MADAHWFLATGRNQKHRLQ